MKISEQGREFIFLVNPEARTGKILAKLQAILTRSPSLAARSETRLIRSDREITPVLQGMTPDMIPVAVGGDGTVNMLVRTFRELNMGNRFIAVLPLGTGNAFAHSIGAGSVRQALYALENGETRSYDIMLTTHPQAPVAVVSISVGFESMFLKKYADWRKYTPAGGSFAGLLRAPHHYQDVSLSVDNTSLVRSGEKVYNLGLYNMPCYAFGWRLPPDKDPKDGYGEAVAYKSATMYWKTLCRGMQRKKSTGSEGFTWKRWQSAAIQTDIPVQVDGETISPGEFEVRIEPGFLKVLTGPAAGNDAAGR